MALLVRDSALRGGTGNDILIAIDNGASDFAQGDAGSDVVWADNGSSWYISGAPNPRWSDDALHQLDRLQGRYFEVVDTSSLPHPH